MSWRISHGQLLELRASLGERELAIVRQVSALRLLSGRQIEALYFPAGSGASAASSARHCRRVLNGLVGDRLLDRLVRRVGGIRAGSASYVYGPGPVGHRLLEATGRGRRYEP